MHHELVSKVNCFKQVKGFNIKLKYLQFPQQQSCRNQPIHRHLFKTKSICKGSRRRESGISMSYDSYHFS